MHVQVLCLCLLYVLSGSVFTNTHHILGISACLPLLHSCHLCVFLLFWRKRGGKTVASEMLAHIPVWIGSCVYQISIFECWRSEQKSELQFSLFGWRPMVVGSIVSSGKTGFLAYWSLPTLMETYGMSLPHCAVGQGEIIWCLLCLNQAPEYGTLAPLLSYLALQIQSVPQSPLSNVISGYLASLQFAWRCTWPT